jgi:hypothetical protein
VLAVLLELFLAVGGEFVVELLMGSRAWWRGAFDEDAAPWLGAVACFVAGGLLGSVSAFAFPGRLLPAPPRAGPSLVVMAPLAGGFAMHGWGSWRRGRGLATSPLATFLGGAGFALGFAFARFALVVAFPAALSSLS